MPANGSFRYQTELAQMNSQVGLSLLGYSARLPKPLGDHMKLPMFMMLNMKLKDFMFSLMDFGISLVQSSPLHTHSFLFLKENIL
jgi:hypothetical protein